MRKGTDYTQNMENKLEKALNSVELMAALKQRLNSLDNNIKIPFLGGPMVERARQIEAKYPNARQYRVFHMFIGSTPGQDQAYYDEDFPGEDALAPWLERELDRLEH